MQSLISHTICPNALTKNFIWDAVGGRPLTGGRAPAPTPIKTTPGRDIAFPMCDVQGLSVTEMIRWQVIWSDEEYIQHATPLVYCIFIAV